MNSAFDDSDNARAIVAVLVQRLGGVVTITQADLDAVTNGWVMKEQAYMGDQGSEGRMVLTLVSEAEMIAEHRSLN